LGVPSDREVLIALADSPDSSGRGNFLLIALKVGVLSLKAARGPYLQQILMVRSSQQPYTAPEIFISTPERVTRVHNAESDDAELSALRSRREINTYC
jgi:hypothetical protein